MCLQVNLALGSRTGMTAFKQQGETQLAGLTFSCNSTLIKPTLLQSIFSKFPASNISSETVTKRWGDRVAAQRIVINTTKKAAPKVFWGRDKYSRIFLT